ncbi:MAG: type I phosphomannose isomerase catalytic subunit [Candidatus Promineifilaceae bacterium]|nr:type I phosphomannose isomerase catalytic subunit [Candidatus Promineifilaceae bacterium]
MTADQPLYPLLFDPVLKDYIWGGRNLETRLNRDLPPDKEIAESWEIAAHANGDVVVKNGPLSGRTLSSLHEEYGLRLIGDRGQWAHERDKFPLLVKLLDANRKLSVQVHPDDDYALQHEGNELGKSEMWVVLHAESDAAVILGVRPGATRQKLADAIQSASLEEFLHKVPVQTGDFICLPAGTLHAILGGLIIAEIQQNSDTTYRVYDWGRLGHDGKPRPLHVDKALDVINFDQVAPDLPTPTLLHEENDLARWQLCRTPYFVVERVEMEAGAAFHDVCDGPSLHIWGAIEGSATLDGAGRQIDLSAVTFTLLPAAMGEYTLTARERCTLLFTYLPEEA